MELGAGVVEGGRLRAPVHQIERIYTEAPRTGQARRLLDRIAGVLDQQDLQRRVVEVRESAKGPFQDLGGLVAGRNQHRYPRRGLVAALRGWRRSAGRSGGGATQTQVEEKVDEDEQLAGRAGGEQHARTRCREGGRAFRQRPHGSPQIGQPHGLQRHEHRQGHETQGVEQRNQRARSPAPPEHLVHVDEATIGAAPQQHENQRNQSGKNYQA